MHLRYLDEDLEKQINTLAIKKYGINKRGSLNKLMIDVIEFFLDNQELYEKWKRNRSRITVDDTIIPRI